MVIKRWRLRWCAWLLFLGSTLPAAIAGPEPVPDMEAMRAKVQALISGRSAAGAPLTLGLLRDALEWSIAYGAPAYNNGDHAGCADFYQVTAQQVSKAFDNPQRVDEAARSALADLRAALERAATITDVDRRAWTMRLAFDQVFLTWRTDAEHGKQLVLLGNGYFRRGQYQEAGVAYAQAAAILAAVRVTDPADLDMAIRVAPLLHAQTAFNLGRYQDAAQLCTANIAAMPELHATGLDLRSLYADRAVLNQAVESLRTAVDAHPADAGLQFLLGYQYLGIGRQDAAITAFRKALAIDANHAASRLLLQAQHAEQDTLP